jgi:amino acid permease
LISGTVCTASAHIITAVIGSGVLSLAWSTAQLGWLFGPVTMMIFSLITYYCSCLLADCYRSGDQVVGKRNYTYMDAVATYLGTFLRSFVKSTIHSTREYDYILNMCRLLASAGLRCFPVC